MPARNNYLACLALIATLTGIACGSDSDAPSCARLADHEATLILAALPQAMQERARDSMGEERKKLLAACKREQPSPTQARCELAATDLAAHRRCETATAKGAAR